MAIHTFKNIEAEMTGWCLSADTQTEITEALSKAAQNNMLSKLIVTANEDTGCNDYTFRYKNASIDSTLSAGDYLVKLNTGEYVAYSKEDFEATYVHTDCDPTITITKSPKQALVDFVKAYYPQAGINSEEDLTSAKLSVVAENLKSWLKNGVFDIKFTDCAITDPTGLAELLATFTGASFITDEVKFTLNFSNGAYNSDTEPNTNPNLFNLIGLQQLYGELRQLKSSVLKRLIGITFQSVGHDAPSAVAPSVTEAQFYDWVDEIRGIAGITTNSAIKR